MRQVRRGVWLGAVVMVSWLLMQAVHELGHVAAAWMTGATVTRVVLHPLAISRTDVEPNPQPLIVAWGGPVVGVMVPLLIWGVVTAARMPGRFLFQFFAGFCLLANGLYLGIGSFGAIGDAGDILRYGSPAWLLWLFGLVTAPVGLSVWNGLGPAFGSGNQAAAIESRQLYFLLGLLAVVLILEFVFFAAK